MLLHIWCCLLVGPMHAVYSKYDTDVWPYGSLHHTFLQHSKRLKKRRQEGNRYLGHLRYNFSRICHIYFTTSATLIFNLFYAYYRRYK